MRGATSFLHQVYKVDNFNPRSSCEERLAFDFQFIRKYIISIHAPHARSDSEGEAYTDVVYKISIHAPHARSDIVQRRKDRLRPISIHAPHARSDHAGIRL